MCSSYVYVLMFLFIVLALIFTGLCDYRCLSQVCRWH